MKPSKVMKLVCMVIGHMKCQIGERCPRCGYIRFVWRDGIEWYVLKHPYVKDLVLIPRSELDLPKKVGCDT